jgi:hypothetical protein
MLPVWSEVLMAVNGKIPTFRYAASCGLVVRCRDLVWWIGAGIWSGG